MLLRASGETEGEELDISAVTKGEGIDSGVEAGQELVAFAEASVSGTEEDVRAARERVSKAIGDEAVVDAAAVIGNFERMVRIADGTGIPLDTPLAMLTADLRDEIGIDLFESAANTPSVNALQKIAGRLLGRVLPSVMKMAGKRPS